MEIDLFCNTQWLSSRQHNFYETQLQSLWWAIVLQIETSSIFLTTSFDHMASHFLFCSLLAIPFWCLILFTYLHTKYFRSFSNNYVPENIPSADPTDSGQKGKDSVSQNAFSGRQFLYHSLLLCSFSIHSPWFQDGNLCFLNHARDFQCILGTTWLLLVLGKIVVHCLIWLCERLDIRLVFLYCFEEDVKY